MRNMILRRTCLRLLTGVSTLAATGALADDVISGNRTIYNGGDLNDITWLDGGHVRYGTVGVEDTLQARIGVHSGYTGTFSVSAGSTLHVKMASRQHQSTFNLGSVVDTGTIIIDPPYLGGALKNLAVNINGGTVVTNSDFPLTNLHLSIASAAVLQLNTSNPFEVIDLRGDGSFNSSGGDLYLSGGDFGGTLKGFGALRIGSVNDGTTTYSTTVLHGRLQDIGNLRVGYGSQLQLYGADLASDIAQIGSVYVSGKFDLGIESTTLNNLTGGGEIGTAGAITVAGSNYGGAIQTGGGLFFSGVNVFDGTSTGNLTVNGGASLTTTNASAFDPNGTVTIDGSYTMQTGTNIGTLAGAGSIHLASGQVLTIDSATNSNFSGQLDGGGGLVKNGTGTLTVTGANSFSGGTSIIQGTLVGNAQSLQGDINNGGTLVFDQATDGTFGGALTGYGYFTKQGAGHLILGGSGTYYGQTTISAGALSVTTDRLGYNIINNASLIFNQNFNGTYSAAISGTGSLRKLGNGKLILSGNNTYAGSTFVTEGTLSVNGMLSSDVLVQSGAKLGGSGTVNSFTAQAGSFITPGNSIGTLNVAGNATFSNGSTYVVEANAAGASDRVNATGQAVIGPSAAVYVTSESGVDTSAGFPQSQTYRIVTAAGGINGTFGSVSDNFAYLVPTLSYGANNVYLTLTREAFVSGGNPPNGNGVGGAIDQLGPGTIYNAVLFMNNAYKPTGLRSLAGELHPSLQRALMDGASYGRYALMERLANGSEQPLWTSAVTGRTSYRSTAETFGLVQDSNLVLAGADVFDAGGWRGGILGGYGNTRVSLSDISATAKIDTFEGGVYGSYTHGGLGFRYGAISSLHRISTDRAIGFSTLAENEKASYLAFTQQAFAEANYRFSHDNGYLEPFLGVTALYQDSQSYRETGGAAALSGQATTAFNQVIDAGLRVQQGLSLGDVDARLVGKIGWQHLFGRNAIGASASIGGSNPFAINGLDTSRDLGIVEAGIGFDLGKRLEVSLKYQGAFGKASRSSAFSARLSASF